MKRAVAADAGGASRAIGLPAWTSTEGRGIPETRGATREL
jgi:hypothetical protein